MANWSHTQSQGWGDFSEGWEATINGTKFSIVVDERTRKGTLYRSAPGGASTKVKDGSVDELKRYAETHRFSRPGAKDMMAAGDMTTPEAIAKMMEAWNKIEAQAKKQFPNASKEELYRITKSAMESALKFKFSRPGAKATFKVEDRFYFGKGRKERFERRMTSQELGHLRNWISNYARNTDEAVNAMNKMQRIFEDDAVFWEDKGWSAVARAAGVLSFSRPGQPERFAITRQPGSCLYANNTGTDVSGYHSAIAKAIEKGGKFDSDFSDVFKLTRSPAGSVCLWSLTWA